MPQNHPKPQLDEPVFIATITPHRSLSPRGLAWLMAFFGVVGLCVSIPFYLLGAWPIVGFMGLDIVLIYAAFRYHNATARSYEQIFLSRITLLIRAVSWRGQVREMRFNPLWSRVVREDHPEFGLEKLEIVEGRARVEIAQALGREERAAFARALQNGLREAKRG
jgi:uncharacterized membrane protein